jgi:exopolysaccharide biosynthesis protein
MTWKKMNDFDQEMPFGMELYKGKGEKLKGFAVKFDPHFFQIKVKKSTAKYGSTLSQFMNAYGALIGINGGYFGFSSNGIMSVSLILDSFKLHSQNIVQINQNGNKFYPTRSAFGIFENDKPEIVWNLYSKETKKLYSIYKPVPNWKNSIFGDFEKTEPTWTPESAVGGGPVLVKKRKVKVCYKEEKFENAFPEHGRAPRSGIGFDAESNIYLILVDGYSAASRGLTLTEFANIFLDFNVIDAMNLDGGGSSQINFKSNILNTPADGRERKIVSALLILPK